MPASNSSTSTSSTDSAKRIAGMIRVSVRPAEALCSPVMCGRSDPCACRLCRLRHRDDQDGDAAPLGRHLRCRGPFGLPARRRRCADRFANPVGARRSRQRKSWGQWPGAVENEANGTTTEAGRDLCLGTPKAVHDTSIRADQIVVKVRPPRTGAGGANDQDPLPTIWGPKDPLPTI